MDNPTEENRAQNWSEVVAACNRSGQTKIAWCAEHGVNPKSFYYWQSKLRRQTADLESATNNIVPLQVVGCQTKETKQPITSAVEKTIRMGIKGMEIVLPSGMTPAYVAALAKALVSG